MTGVVEAPATTSPGDTAALVPVYAVWDADIGPLLSLGMLTAAARHHRGGALGDQYEIRRPELASSFLQDLAGRSGPAILLCSDYVWSIDQNLELAAQARALNPKLLVVHGGPSSPKYPGDAERFLDEHGAVAHVLVRGEGEATLCDLLDRLAPALADLDPDHLDGGTLGAVAGITFRNGGSAEVVRTPDRERIAELDALPSPYLSGEFDDIDPGAWYRGLSLETNRGCPYGCTFCDWGSATLSRIRKFSSERVLAEIEWAASRGVARWQICDANFGILARDVEFASRIHEIRPIHGAPDAVAITPAKNTTRHLRRILDHLLSANIELVAAISLQTTDPHTLEAVNRSNISTDAYLKLAADLRQRGVPLQGDVLLGLPGQTYASFRADLQFFLDHEIMTRTWLVQLLPNAPMNEPEYKARHAIEVNENKIVVATATFTRAERAQMERLHRIEAITERFGIFRHVMRWLQWDHGVDATRFMDLLIDLTRDHPHRYPQVSWLLTYFDRFPTVAAGWGPFYDEVGDLIERELGIERSTAMRSVLAIQEFLMPSPGRAFPDTIDLDHDYLAYYRAVTDTLYTTGEPTAPVVQLADHPPASFTIEGDPLGLCLIGLNLGGDAHEEVLQSDFHLGTTTAHELASPLNRFFPVMSGMENAFVDTAPPGGTFLEEEDGVDGAVDDIEAAERFEQRVELQRARAPRLA